MNEGFSPKGGSEHFRHDFEGSGDVVSVNDNCCAFCLDFWAQTDVDVVSDPFEEFVASPCILASHSCDDLVFAGKVISEMSMKSKSG